MNSKYYGVWPTMIGAFDKDLNVDIKANKEVANYLVEKGSHGLFTLCQSTEMFYFNLEEKVALVKAVVEEVNHRIPVFASGHTSDNLDDQIEELRAISKTGVDAVVLVSNRLDINNEKGDTLINSIKKIFEALPDVEFGIYECPYPYLRLLSDDEVKFLADSNRCTFIKDVSCNEEIQKRRCAIVKGTNLNLFNANTATLLSSLKEGYVGYNGVMGNFHIDLYRYLFENYKTKSEICEWLQKELTEKSTIEKYFYPVNAKYHMQNDGVNLTLASRKLKGEVFSDEDKKRVDDLFVWEKNTREKLS
ncbi:MAG: dihydrodipicolinate synthase family protein [Anaerorhabdus sp.]